MLFSFRRLVSTAALVAFASTTSLAGAAVPQSALVRPLLVGGSGGGPARIPTGQFLTATAATGSIYQRLTTGLRPDGNADADSAMTSALSPDGKTLLVLTSGFNVSTNKQVPQTASAPVPLLFPALNPLTGIDSPFVNPNGSFAVFDAFGNPTSDPTKNPGTQLNQAEFVLVYDVHTGTPRKTQQIYVPDTFDGLSWSPDGQRFYVSGGVDDRVLVYKVSGTTTTASRGSGVARAQPSAPHAGRVGVAISFFGPTPTFVPDAPFVILNHDDLDTQTFPLYDGGILRKSPLGQAALAPGAPAQVALFARLITGGIASGLSVSNDGKTMLVANFEDASASLVDLTTRKVTSEITFTPPGQTLASAAKGEFPFWTAIKSDFQSGAFVKGYVTSYRDDDVMVVKAGSTTATEIKTCAGPNKAALNGDGSRLYVACGNDDAIAVIDTATDTVARTISLARPGYAYKGSSPNSIAVSPNGTTLYVTLGGENAVAIVDVASGQVRGRIPTGWMPTSVSLSADGKRLFVVNEKSNEGPNPGQIYYSWNTAYGAALNPTNANLYTWEGEKSGLTTIPIPDNVELSYLSAIVDANDGFSEAQPDSVMSVLRSKIKHVIYIVNENRTFDQVLGDLGNGSNGDPQITFFTRDITPNLHALAEDYVTLDNFYDASETSGVGWNWAMQSHTNDFVEKTQPVQYGNSNGYALTYDWQGIVANMNLGQPAVCGTNPTIFDCRITTIARGGSTDSTILPGYKDPAASAGADNLTPGTHGGYIWESALRAGKTVRNYGWQIDLNYYGTPLGPQEVRDPGTQKIAQSSPSTPSIKPLTDVYYRAFDQSYPDTYRIEEWKREFDAYVKNGNLPNLTVMTIPHDHTGSFGASAAFTGLGTPQLELADHDYAIGKLVEAVSHSPYWASTAIVMIEDDPQDGQDHVEAHRSIAHIISPYTKSHFVDHTTYTTVNVVRTVEDLLGIDHLSMYDNNAVPMSSVFTTAPNLQAYAPIIPGSLCVAPVHPDLVPECFSPQARYRKTAPVPQLHDSTWWEGHTKGMDFTHPDRVNSRAFNAVLEYGITGRGSLPARAALLRTAPDADADADGDGS